VRCPCGFHSTRVKHSGRRRAPPGSTTRPCQELADDSPAYPKRFPARRLGPRREAGQGVAKAGPATDKSPQIACANASLLERMWRAERRPRDLRIASYKICVFRRAIPSYPGRRNASRQGIGMPRVTPAPACAKPKRVSIDAPGTGGLRFGEGRKAGVQERQAPWRVAFGFRLTPERRRKERRRCG
jgi:hypothetical protein